MTKADKHIAMTLNIYHCVRNIKTTSVIFVAIHRELSTNYPAGPLYLSVILSLPLPCFPAWTHHYSTL